MKKNVTKTYSCGHDTRVLVSSSEAASMEEFPVLKKIIGNCPNCTKQHCSDVANSQKLPVLRGSDKQVEWASDIRSKIIGGIERIQNEAAAEIERWAVGRSSETLAKSPLIIELQDKIKLCEKVKAIADASFWIQHKNLQAKDILNRVAAI